MLNENVSFGFGMGKINYHQAMLRGNFKQNPYRGQSCESPASWCHGGRGGVAWAAARAAAHRSLSGNLLWPAIRDGGKERRVSMGRSEGSSTPFSIWKSSMAYKCKIKKKMRVSKNVITSIVGDTKKLLWVRILPYLTFVKEKLFYEHMN